MGKYYVDLAVTNTKYAGDTIESETPNLSIPKKHHFVPQWYLKNFFEGPSGVLHVYDKMSNTFRIQRPKKVMAINNYYAQEWAGAGVDPNILELFAGRVIEPRGKDALELLLNNRNRFTEETTSALLVYLSFQRVRVPRQAESARKLAELYTLTQQDRVLAEAFRKGEVSLSESVRFLYMQSVLKTMTNYMIRMQWDIITSESDSFFITTDSPVTFYNQQFPPPTEAGIGLAGTKILFPIDPHHMLIIKHPEYGCDTDNPLEKMPEPTGKEVGISITSYPAPISNDTVLEINKLMYAQCDRLIVSNSKKTLGDCIV